MRSQNFIAGLVILLIVFSPLHSRADEKNEKKEKEKKESTILAASPLQAAKASYRSLNNRWRILDANGITVPRGSIIDPYNQNTLKGDFPVIGLSTFAVLTILNNPKATFNNQDNVDNNFNNNAVGALEFFHGHTVFKPKDWSVKGEAKAVFNRGNNDVEDVGVQQLFGEVKLFDVSPYYDFVSTRLGIQFIKTDFNGFIFQDFNLAGQVFGELSESRYDWNLGYLKTLEKNENNLLTLETQDQEIFFGTIELEDFLRPGFNGQLSVHHHRNQVGFNDLNVTYVGFASDGIWGRCTFNPAVYFAFGSDDAFNVDIAALLAGAEFAYERDYMIFRLAGFFSSGDDDPNDDKAGGFAAINENINLFGGGNSFVIGGAAFTKPNSFIPAGLGAGSQFDNPGMLLANAGLDVIFTPKLFFASNFNYFQFVDTATIGNGSSSIGFEVNGAFNYRIDLNENLILQAAANAFFPQSGVEALVGTDMIFTGNLALVLLY